MKNFLRAEPPPLWMERFRRIGRLAQIRKARAALVGGPVRDLRLGRVPFDWDVIIEGAVADLVAQFAADTTARVATHPTFLTYHLTFPDGTELDIATAREETYPRPAALPVVRAASLERDFYRRDFTVNALALELGPDGFTTLLDPLKGSPDLDAGVLRLLHPQSFLDDPTRIYRAARYAGRYTWTLHPDTERLLIAAIQNKALEGLSPVRRRNELFHILEEETPGPALLLLDRWGGTPFSIPAYTLSTERLAALRAAGTPRLVSRLALLLGPDPARVDAELKRCDTPVILRRAVGAALVPPTP